MIAHKSDAGSILIAALLLPVLSLLLRAQQLDPVSPLPRPAEPARAAQRTIFAENIGQWSQGVAFQGTQGSTAIRFERGEVRYRYLVDSAGRSSSRSHILSTEFIGARSDHRIIGEHPTETLYNYYLGADSSRWHAGARGFSQIRYRGLYNGIDAVYHGTGGSLKYDFIVAPGADHRVIRLRYNGARRLGVLPSGELDVATEFGSVREAPPYSYQEIGGRRVEVEARYRLLGDNSYGFELGRHNPRYPVVIDPCLSVEYSTYLGGGSYDVVTSMATDSTGAAYAIGFTRAPDFPVIPREELEQENYVFISKFSPDGSALLYSTVIARTYSGIYAEIVRNGSVVSIGYESIGEDVEVTRTGEAVVAMTTNIDDLPTTNGAYRRQRAAENLNSQCGPPAFPNFDAYVVRLNNAGKMVWGSYLGGSDNDYVSDIALDPIGNVYITGLTYAPQCGSRGDTLSFPTTVARDAFGSAAALRNFETYVAALSSDGRALQFGALYGGTGNEVAGKIGIDPAGKVYLLGSTNSNDLRTTANAYQSSAQPGLGSEVYDVYIARINPANAQLEYSSYFADNGGAGRRGLGTGVLRRRTGYASLGGFDRQDRRQGLVVEDAGGTIIFGGSTRSTGLPTTSGAFQGGLRNPGSDTASFDCFVVRMNLNTNQLLASTYLGGSDFDGLGGLALDKFGDITIGISTRSADFPLSAVNIQPELRGKVDAVVASISPDGARLTYATFFGGTVLSGTILWEQSVYGLTADREGGIYLFGGTASRDIPLTRQAVVRENDYYGGYIVKFAAPSAPKIGVGLSIAFDPNLCGDMLTERQVIFNSGQSPMRIDSLKFSRGRYYSLINPPVLPMTLAPCDTISLTIAFNALELECNTRGNDSLIIVAPAAVVPRVTVPVTGRRNCVSFFFSDTAIDLQRYKLGSGHFVGFGINVRGNADQFITVVPDPGNQGIFSPATPIIDKVYPEGTSSLAFRVNATDTGYYCETFTATIQPCNRVRKLRICAYVKSGFFTAEDTVDYGLISCKEIREPFVVRNTGNDTLAVRIAYVTGPNQGDINFEEDVQSVRMVPPKDSTIFNLVVRPIGAGRHESIVVFQTDEGGEEGRQHLVTLRSELDTVAFRMSSVDVIGGFGEIVDLPVQYEPIVEGRIPLEELTLYLKYDPKLLDVAGLNTAGALAAGWEITRNDYVDSGAIIRLSRGPNGSTFSGNTGLLATLRMKVLRGDTAASPLDIQLAGASKGCLLAEIDSGRVFQLNAECAAALRLLSSNRQLLKQSIPNPASRDVTINYDLPAAGYVTLVVYDALGREALRLIDGYRPAGAGSLTFDARAIPSGRYYYRITVDDNLAETRTMVIER